MKLPIAKPSREVTRQAPGRPERRHRIVPSKIGGFFHAAEGASPLPESECAVAVILEAGNQILVFDKPLAALNGARRGHRPLRHVEIQGSRYTHAVGAREQASEC